MESSPAAAMAPASSSRARDPLLFASFDLPASWGCRKPMTFWCRDRDRDTDDDDDDDDDAPEPATAAAAAVPSGPRSPVTEAPVVAGEEEEEALQAQAQQQQEAAPPPPTRRQWNWNLRERTSWRDYRRAEDDARQGARKLWSTDTAGGGGRSRASSFSVALTRQEIDADFVAITGRKAPRRPRKRAKSVQRQIETLCPGSSLMEVTRDRYKVNEKGGF